MRRRLPFILPLVFFVGLAVYLVFGLQHTSEVGSDFVPSALLGKPFPAMDLPPLLSNKPGLTMGPATSSNATSNSRSNVAGGEVAVVNVFASWCVPCRMEHPMITRLAQKEGVKVLGLNYKDKPEDARGWLAELGDPYAAIGMDPDGRAGIDLGVYGVPETYVVDQEGIIRFRHVGPLQLRHLEDDILPLIKELTQ